jgi:hypothetical protein
MKKVLVLSIVLMAFCVPTMAGTYIHDMGALSPIKLVGGSYIPQQLDLLIAPWGTGGPLGLKGSVDPITKAPIIDSVTGLQVMEIDFSPAMHAQGTAPTQVIFQSATLVKVHQLRKSVCMQWCDDNIVQPPSGVASSVGIRTSWPLMFETNGTTFELTINYGTTRFTTHPAIGTQTFAPSKGHTEIYRWKVVADQWSDMENAIELFWRLPVGSCELTMITSKAVRDRLLQYLNGWQPYITGTPAVKGFKALAAAVPQDRAGYNLLYQDFKNYLSSFNCWQGCCQLNGVADPSSPCVPAPDAQFNSIIDTCAAPVASILLTDLFEISKKLGIMSAGQ